MPFSMMRCWEASISSADWREVTSTKFTLERVRFHTPTQVRREDMNRSASE